MIGYRRDVYGRDGKLFEAPYRGRGGAARGAGLNIRFKPPQSALNLLQTPEDTMAHSIRDIARPWGPRPKAILI